MQSQNDDSIRWDKISPIVSTASLSNGATDILKETVQVLSISFSFSSCTGIFAYFGQ